MRSLRKNGIHRFSIFFVIFAYSKCDLNFWDMAKFTKAELAEINKQTKDLFELLLKKTGSKKKDVYDLAEQRFIVANLDVLTSAEKKQFTKLVF